VSQVSVLKNSNPDIGLYTRNATIGKEYAMIEQLIDYYCSKFTYDDKKNQLAVFVEPRISDKEILSRKFPAAGKILS